MQLKIGINLEVESFKSSVIHQDYDGLISGLAINNYLNIPIGGVFELHQSRYNPSRLVLPEEVYLETINEYLYIDLAMKHKTIVTIDHHGSIPSVYNQSKNIINCNRYYSKSFDLLQYDAIKHKNPTGCIIWILYLLGISIDSFTEEQRILLAIADGLHSNYLKYTSNVENWLNMWGMSDLIHTLRNTSYAQFQTMRERIGIGTGSKAYFSFDEIQSKFTWQNGRSLDVVADNICEIMNWKRIEIPKMKIMYLFSNHSEKATNSSINELMNDDDILSVCVNKGDGEMYYSRFTGNTVDLH